MSRYGAVIQDCTDAIALDPTYIKAYMRRGTARRKLNKLEEALGDFRQIKKLSPDDKLAQREIASLEQVTILIAMLVMNASDLRYYNDNLNVSFGVK